MFEMMLKDYLMREDDDWERSGRTTLEYNGKIRNKQKLNFYHFK